MKRRTHWIRIAWTLALCWPLGAWADQPGGGQSYIGTSKPDDQGQKPLPYRSAQLVVKMAPGASPAEYSGEGAVLGVAGSLAHSQTYLLALVPGVNVDSAAAALTSSGEVAWAHPNYVFNTLHPVQGSYPFPDVQGTGHFEGQPASLALALAAAHAQATGAGVKVGVLDAGLDFGHPLLSQVAASGHDFVDGDETAQEEPGGLASGHGTFVAGLVHLVAPEAQPVAYRVADGDGRGDGFTLARAIELAADQGCRVLNISLVLTRRHLAVRDAVLYAESQGVLVVAAAGNSGSGLPLYPAAEQGVMAVGALGPANERAPFSSYGSHLSVCAPGIDLYSAFGPGYAWWSGTSFAAPLAAGLAALVAERLPDASIGMLRGVIEVTATDVSAENPSLPGLLGHGEISPAAALEYTQVPETATVTPDTLYFTHQVGRLYLLAPFQHVLLESSNAPATYLAQVSGPDAIFSWVRDSVGTTPDSARIEINPLEVAGTYYNTILFHVDGVAEPARLVIQLDVEAPGTGPTAWVHPEVVYFQAQFGTEILLSKHVLVASDPPGLAYTAQVLSSSTITSLERTSGVTHDSLRITVSPAHAFSPGTYEDTVVFQVEGVPYPIPLFVVVQISDSLVFPQDSAWVVPSTLHFTTVEGFAPAVMLSDWVTVYSPGAPRTFVAGAYGPDPIFTYFTDSTGVTSDSIEILVNPAGHSAGTYTNTVRFYVHGVSQPALLHVILTVYTDSSGGSDTAAVVPSVLSLQAPAGSGILERTVLLYSTNAPASYFAYTLNWPSFVTIPDSVGQTPDSVRLQIDPTGLAPGLYADTVIFDVQGTSFSPYLVVQLEITSGDTLAPVTPRNYPNPFNPETQISFALTHRARVQLVIFNILGERVRVLTDGELPAGEQRFVWNGANDRGGNSPSGVYFYRLTVQDKVYTGKMMMLR